MATCPRCGNRTERLHPLPAEATVEQGGTTGVPLQTTRNRVCRWCLHEVTEG